MMHFTEIDKRYLPSLSRVFSPKVMDDLIQQGKSDYLDEVIDNSGIGHMIHRSQSLGEFFDVLYDFLSKNYCIEYVYKNILAEQVYLGTHFANSHMLTELRVGACKADVVILNGTSTVYEIKSDLDSFDRLDAQILAYTSFFDRINVIASLSHAEKLYSRLSPDIGIMTLDSDNCIVIRREPLSNKSCVKPSVIFNSFRKSEYLNIIKEQFGFVPDVPNTKIHQVCLEMFGELSPETAHDAMLRTLQRRGNTSLLKQFVQMAPRSLKACATSYSTNELRITEFRTLLEQSVSSVISHILH